MKPLIACSLLAAALVSAGLCAGQSPGARRAPRIAPQPAAGATFLSFLTPSRLLVGTHRYPPVSSSDSVAVWDVRRGRREEVLLTGLATTNGAALSPSGKLLAFGGDDPEGLQVWDIGRRALARKVGTGTAFYDACAFAPGDRTLALLASYRVFEQGRLDVQLLDLPSGELRAIDGSAGATALAVSPRDGSIAAGIPGYDQPITPMKESPPSSVEVRVWDPTGSRVVRTLGSLKSHVWALAYSPDGSRLAAFCADGAIRLWDTTTGGLLHTLTESGPVLSRPFGGQPLAFSPDGRTLATATRGEGVHVWDVGQGALVRTLRPRDQTEILSGVVLSPDGKRIAATGSAGVIYVWDAASGRRERMVGIARQIAPRKHYSTR